MRCDMVQDSIAADYIDGLGTPQERSVIGAHLEACAECREFHETVRQTREVFAQAPRLTPSPAVWEAIEEGIQPRPAWWEGWLVAPRPAFALAMSVAVCLIVGTVSLTSVGSVRHAATGESVALAFLEDEQPGQDIVDSGFGSLAEEMAS